MYPGTINKVRTLKREARRAADLPHDRGTMHQWTTEEDALLQKVIAEIGSPHEPKGPVRVTWNDVADRMTPFYPERKAKSCRLRWETQLARDINYAEFTAEEQDFVYEFANTFGNKWSEAARQLSTRAREAGRFPWRRTDNMVKNLWHSRFKTKNKAKKAARPEDRPAASQSVQPAQTAQSTSQPTPTAGPNLAALPAVATQASAQAPVFPQTLAYAARLPNAQGTQLPPKLQVPLGTPAEQSSQGWVLARPELRAPIPNAPPMQRPPGYFNGAYLPKNNGQASQAAQKPEATAGKEVPRSESQQEESGQDVAAEGLLSIGQQFQSDAAAAACLQDLRLGLNQRPEAGEEDTDDEELSEDEEDSNRKGRTRLSTPRRHRGSRKRSRSRSRRRRPSRIPSFESGSTTSTESDPDLMTASDERASLSRAASPLSNQQISNASSQPRKTMSVNALHGGEVSSAAASQAPAEEEQPTSLPGPKQEEVSKPNETPAPSSQPEPPRPATTQAAGPQQRQGLEQLATAAASRLPKPELNITFGSQNFSARPRPSMPLEQNGFQGQRQGVLAGGATYRSPAAAQYRAAAGQPVSQAPAALNGPPRYASPSAAQYRVAAGQPVSQAPAALNGPPRYASPAAIRGPVQSLPRYTTAASANPLLPHVQRPAMPMVARPYSEPVAFMSVHGVLTFPVPSNALSRGPQPYPDLRQMRPEGRVSATFTPYGSAQPGMPLETTTRIDRIPQTTTQFTFAPQARPLSADLAQLSIHQRPRVVANAPRPQLIANPLNSIVPSQSLGAARPASIAARPPPAEPAGQESSGSEEDEQKAASPQNGETSCSFQMPSVRARQRKGVPKKIEGAE